MLVPFTWLQEFVPYEGTPQALGDRLTMLGLELEGILHPFEHLADIKAGFVASCIPHPNSDHLHCCKVDIGNGELLDIVCGAPNVAQDQKVAVAPVGAKLPDGTVIKKAKLRGEPSCGMICSERELGLSDDHGGILVLPDSADIGHSLLNVLNLERDVLDLSITPNRADCLSIMGIARETAMALNLPLHFPDLPLIMNNQKAEASVKVTIDAPELCWLYGGRVVRNINIGISPMRMRYRLLAAGQRAISNIVDITNYILFETGQPLHAFDLDKLAGNQIIVRKARQNEVFITLDGKERKLIDTDLCICDAEKTVALAGVMGGLDSEITNASKNVFIESAIFKPQIIRKTARRLGLHSEASFRFERGVDQRQSIWAMNRACSLMESIAQGIPDKEFSCEEPKPFIPKHIEYRPKRAISILGVDIDRTIQKKALEADGCAVEENTNDNWTIIQPSWRPDLTREADIIEEVGRIYGLDAIEPTIPCIKHPLDENLGIKSNFTLLSDIRHWAAGIGLNEVINYSFVGARNLDLLNYKEKISISNPLSDELNTMRPYLAPGLLEDLKNNLAFGVHSIRLFEIANTFTQDKNSETTVNEIPYLGILLYGLNRAEGWPKDLTDLGYGDLKGLIANFFNYLHIPDLKITLSNKYGWLEPALEIFADKKLAGFMGKIVNGIAKVYNAQKSVWLCELNLQVLLELNKNFEIRFKPLAVYPPVRRDITVITSPDIKAGMIQEKILSRKLPLLEEVALVDYFEPENKEEKNFTFRLTFRHPARTLNDPEVDKEREKMAEFLRRELNARI